MNFPLRVGWWWNFFSTILRVHKKKKTFNGYIPFLCPAHSPLHSVSLCNEWCSTYSKVCKNIHWHTINLGIVHNKVSKTFFFSMPMSNIYDDDDVFESKREKIVIEKFQVTKSKDISSFATLSSFKPIGKIFRHLLRWMTAHKF